MNIAYKRSLLILFFTLLNIQFSFAQKGAADILKLVGSMDVHTLWRADSISIEDGTQHIKFPEPIGFIGSNYQRFYIHYSSVTKHPANPYQYIVTGKTRVNKNICPFRGTITIKKANLLPVSDLPGYRQGVITADINFSEDSTIANSGQITGSVQTNICIDRNNKITYDGAMFTGDGFRNNQCISVWRSYKTGNRKKCNWGDCRIPANGDLDVGAGQFVINEKYRNNGWQNYFKAWVTASADDPESLKAQELEAAHWWE